MANFVRRYGVCFEKALCYFLVIVITPCFFIFEMAVVRPIIIDTYNFGPIKYVFHTICPTFCFTNIVGNMILCIFTDTSLKETKPSGDYCDHCKLNRSPGAWHCGTCHTCIQRRDHHCFFFSRCIGIRNLRYYILYLGYVFISLAYSTFYNYYYVVNKFNGHEVYLSAFRVINPYFRYLMPEPMGVRDICVLFLFLNVGLVIWMGGLFWIHMRNVLRGVTAREYKESQAVCWNIMKKNFVKVFGQKWYWAVIWPFADSPLLDEMKFS